MLNREGVQGPGDVAIVGGEDSVAEQISALADLGVTDFVAGEFGKGAEAERTRALLKVMIQQQAVDAGGRVRKASTLSEVPSTLPS